MALSATGVHEVRSGGSDNNAGYFNPSGGSPGTDFSQQDAAQVTIDGVTISAAVHTTTTQINITGTTVASSWNRNGLNITGGTATAGLYEITAVDVANNRITVDRSAGTSTQTVTGAMGGAKATPGAVLATAIAANTVWIKNGTYSCSASSNVAGGRLTVSVSNLKIFGYNSTRGDIVLGDSTRPILQCGANSMSLITLSTGNFMIRDLVLDGNKAARTSTTCMTSTATGQVYHCQLKNATSNGGDNTNNTQYTLCEFNDNGGYGCYANSASLCYSHDNTSHGFQILGRGGIDSCILKSNGGDGARTLTSSVIFRGNIAYGNTGAGLRQLDASGASIFMNNICYGNTSFGIQNSGDYAILLNNALGSNTAGATSGTVSASGTVSLTSDPFTNASSGNFTLNSTSGGGLELKATSVLARAFPSAFPGLPSTTNYQDIGAVQAAPSAGGSSSLIGSGLVR